MTGAEGTAKRGQALPAPLLLAFHLQLLLLCTDNGLKNPPPASFSPRFVFYLNPTALTAVLKFKRNEFKHQFKS